MKRYIICDIDGTVADLTHRRHHVENRPKNWKAFQEASIDDPPHQDIVALLERLDQTHQVILVSGRNESERSLTEKWFRKHVNIFMPPLFMRHWTDYRADDIVKEEIYLKTLKPQYITPETTWFVLDDRQRVVDMWRRNGFRVLQVAPGDF